MDSISQRILSLIQVELPLTPAPYHTLGEKLGIDGDEVIHRLEQLKARGIIRQISPVLDARSLGYRSTLVAMRVAESQLDKAAQLIAEHPRVSHAYGRNHHFNFWFTLTIPPTTETDIELKRIGSRLEPEAIFALPVIKQFKLSVFFGMEKDRPTASAVTRANGNLPAKAELSDRDRMVINELQQDLPLIAAPFDAMAERLEMSVADFLRQCQSLKERDVMRRYAAAINHRQAGFKANAMTCWVASPDMVEIAGQKLASLREVSHCYERKTNPLWQYNLFAMIHGHSREACQEIADKVSHETGLTDYVLLFSTREFKKVRNIYLV